jgi:hypothetical protein
MPSACLLRPPPETSPEDRLAARRLNVTVPHSARIWNYWLGGKDHFTVDRAVGEQLRETYPAIVNLARTDRQFLGRAVRYLAGEAGIRQFLDIGSGLPAVGNTHEVAQRIAPESHCCVQRSALTSASPRHQCPVGGRVDSGPPADPLQLAGLYGRVEVAPFAMRMIR